MINTADAVDAASEYIQFIVLIKEVNIMDEILNLSINEMPQTEFDCSCGKHHNFSVHDMSIRKGAIEDLPKMAEPFKDGKILVVFDNHTYEVAGKRAVELLKENGFNVKELLFDTGDDILIPDEKTLGRIVQEQDLDTSLMVAVGSGVINDSVKFVTSVPDCHISLLRQHRLWMDM